MRDSYGRKIEYLRVSVTDRCNLRCVYCMPEKVPDISHTEILRYEEILRICRIMAGLGIRAVRVTGGEAFVRKGCRDFLRELCRIEGIERVSVTTNGAAFAETGNGLDKLGVKGINISLDTLDENEYKSITGGGSLQNALAAIDEALRADLDVKINCVPIKGLNESSVLPVGRLAEKLPVRVRFIELMPKGSAAGMEGIPGAKVLDELLSAWPDLTADTKIRGYGPAVYYKSAALQGSVGLISAVSSHFCGGCNRVRLTSQGLLKLCLYHEDALDVKAMLREGRSDSLIAQAIQKAVYSKPERHFFEPGLSGQAITAEDGMFKIGG